MTKDVVTIEILEKAISITKEALDKAKLAEKDPARLKEADDFLDMANRYFCDAQHFQKKGDYTLAYGAVHYAHAWLDAGARLKLFIVKDSRLFTVDD